MNPGEYAKMFELEDHYWWFVGRRRVALRLLEDALKNTSDASQSQVLDLGCGTGVVCRDMSSWAQPIGLDMSPLALSFSVKRGLKHLIQADGVALPLASDSVEGVIGLDIYEHIEDHVAAFRETYRVLKPGGVLVLSVPAFKSLWSQHDIALMHFRRYRRPEIGTLLEEAGFQVEKLSYSVFFLFPIVVIWRIVEKFKRGPAEASLVPVPEWANRALIALQDLEARIIARGRLPWGSSVIAVARKPKG